MTYKTCFLIPYLWLIKYGLQSYNYGFEKTPAIIAYYAIELLSDILIL